MKLLGGKPLMQWTIEAAEAARVFSRIVVSSDSPEILSKSRAVLWHLRKPVHATDEAQDILWVRDVMMWLPELPDAFAILRPTSPFRTAETIRRAYRQFTALPEWFGSMRAVERWTGHHPAKMWYLKDDYIDPVDDQWTGQAPRHSSPTQLLPAVVRQNASLEMAWTECVTLGNTIAGNHVSPFFTEGIEGMDINTPEDWAEAERLVALVTA